MYKNDMKNGLGEQYWQNKHYYYGYFKNDQMDGKGIYFYDSG